MKEITNRREFIKRALGTAAVFSAPALVPSSALGLAGTVPPSERIIMGVIGVGGMGGGHFRSLLGYEDVRIAAVCDVRKERRDSAKELADQKYENTDCQTYNDFRELLAREDIDAILTATPDNWHSLIGLEAARRGKDMYYEKPLSMSVEENLALYNAVKRYGVVFQFGTQQRSDSKFRMACELARNGKIGELKTIATGSASYGQIPLQPVEPVPEGLDYEMWLGPAPWAPYTTVRCTRQFTLLRDYSLGCIGGAWGIHDLDIAQWANNADHTGPIDVEGTGFIPEGFYDTAQIFNIEHTYKNGVKLFHMDSKTSRERFSQFKLDSGGRGVLAIGSEGWVFASRNTMDSQPKSLLTSGLNSQDEHLERSEDHRRNFLNAVKSRGTPISPIEAALHSDILSHQADIAIRLKRKLYWDPEKYEFINDPEANRLLSRPMRNPWHI